MLDATLPSFLKEIVRRYGERTAAVFCQSGERWSYEEFSAKVDQFAAGLLSLGLYKGDRIGIWSPNRPEWLIAQFATARIGLILVNINPAYKNSELEYALNKVGARALILAPQHKSSNYVEMLQSLAPELDTSKAGRLKADRLPGLQIVINLGAESTPGMMRFDDVMGQGGAGNKARLDAISDSLSPNDAINIQFTSGTTGAPKGATLTHRSIINNAISCARAMRLSSSDALCIPVPFYHCFGMVLGNLAAAAYGVKMVFPGDAFEPKETLVALHEERCTAVHGVPTMFSAMIDHPDFATFDLSSLRTGIMAGSPCPEPLMRRVMSDMGCSEITIAYGMTETSPVSFQTEGDDPIEQRVSSVGRIQPHCEVRVVDAEAKTTAIDEPGELLTKGYLVMQKYWGEPEQTENSIIDGWMHTGDLATIDKNGYCRIVGRIKDMLIRGGENIYPAEIEAFLITHPGIAEAQVFGVPDDKYGEAVSAWIIARDAGLTAEDVRAFCKGQIAHFKIPAHIKFITEMPMTATGKPQKFVMREKMMKDLGIAG